jgi:Mandelate racemase / muconate lactonizing enzyme, N-terminal domain/Enolase C-terminal domain-like
MAVSPALTVRAVRTVAVAVPMRFALGTSAATVREAPLLLVDLDTEEGITGRSYLFCYRPSGAAAIAAVLHDAAALIAGEPVAPLHNAAKLERRFALIGVTGVVRMALSALDMALWDALAVAAGQPLATLLGGAPRPIPAYNSCGLGLIAPEAAADEAEQLLAGGFKAVKLRLGHATLAEDLAVTRAVRRRLADDIAVMVDYNQALTVAQALERGRARWPMKASIGSKSRSAMTTSQAGARRRRLRFRDAGRRAHRRRHRMAAGRGRRRLARRRNVVPPDARTQRPPAGGDADRPLARICRLGQCNPGGAARSRRRRHHRNVTARHRPHLER